MLYHDGKEILTDGFRIMIDSMTTKALEYVKARGFHPLDACIDDTKNISEAL